MSWMQNIRDGAPAANRRPLFGCLFRHDWQVCQHNFEAAEVRRLEVVIAWKQCRRCGASRLIHILK